LLLLLRALLTMVLQVLARAGVMLVEGKGVNLKVTTYTYTHTHSALLTKNKHASDRCAIRSPGSQPNAVQCHQISHYKCVFKLMYAGNTLFENHGSRTSRNEERQRAKWN
jgi:hypothetical protein